MKKTLTVNLGGTVFHIDEDAYRLLDNYLSNLKIHFRKEAGADEIIDDIERRISELFTEKLAAGSQVITIAYVEEVIARMGKPEELEPDAGDAASGSGSWDGSNHAGNTGAGASATTEKVSHHFYRNPDDKMLGGVVSGLAAYWGWDVASGACNNHDFRIQAPDTRLYHLLDNRSGSPHGSRETEYAGRGGYGG